MFTVVYHSSKNRRVQKGVRDPKISKWKCFYKAFVEAFEGFCTTTSFSPLRFVFQRKRYKLDIVLWISVTTILTVLAIVFVEDFLIKFDAMSTKTIVNTQQRSTITVNFPSITVCAASSFTYSKVYSFLQNYILKHPTLRESVNITKIIKSFTLVDATQSDFEEMDIVLETYNITMKDVFFYTAQNCDELFQRCKWEGEIRPCSHLFKKVFGGGNFCCSFNYPVPPSVVITKNFLKTKFFGRDQGLSFVARPIRDKFYYRSDYGRNLRIILHHAYSFPLYNENDIFAPMRKETNIDLDSIYNQADDKVRQLPIKLRDCIFAHEMKLQHFPIYSYSNCLLDCRVNRIIHACGCATYFYPSVNTSICEPSKLFCNLLNQNLDVRTKPDGTISIENCDCPDDCVILKLHYSVQSTDFIGSNNFTVDEFYQEYNQPVKSNFDTSRVEKCIRISFQQLEDVKEDNGIVHINFSKSFTKYLQRKLILDEIELAANVGGIIALFMGCSLVSIFEIVYFLSIRLFANYKRLCLQNNLVSVSMYLE